MTLDGAHVLKVNFLQPFAARFTSRDGVDVEQKNGFLKKVHPY